tara:strand:- start:5896 stop:10176 length:4281 start_codon:yes stop_codon:yes gene_type:complete
MNRQNLNINYVIDDNEFGKGYLTCDLPNDFFYPGFSVVDTIFNSLGDITVNEYSEGHSSGNDYLNLLVVEFKGMHDDEETSPAHILYFNYSYLNGHIDSENRTLNLPLTLPNGYKVKIGYLAGVNSQAGAMNTGGLVTYLKYKESAWEVIHYDNVPNINNSNLEDIYASCTYGGTYSNRDGATGVTLYDSSSFESKGEGLAGFSTSTADDLGFDYDMLNQKLQELYDNDNFSDTNYPHITGTYLDMLRFKNSSGEYNWMRQSRCGDILRVWIASSMMDDNFAIKLNGIPQYTDRVLRWDQIKDNQLQGVRVGNLPIIQREFSNPTLDRWNRIKNQQSVTSEEETSIMPEIDAHGIMGDIEDEIYGYETTVSANQLFQAWSEYGDDSLLQNDWTHETSNFQTLFESQHGTVDGLLLASHTRLLRDAVGQYFYANGSWQAFDFENDVLQMQEDLNINYDTGYTTIDYNFTNIPSWLALGAEKGLPLNRALTSYEPSQSAIYNDGLWTYIDIDIDSRMLSDGIYQVNAEFGYWNKQNYSWLDTFLPPKEKYCRFKFNNSMPTVSYQYHEDVPFTWNVNDFQEWFNQSQLNASYEPDMIQENIGWYPFSSNTQAELFLPTYDYADENAPWGANIYQNLGNTILNPNQNRTSLLWKQHFGMESTAGVVAKTGIDRFKWSYNFTTGSDFSHFIENQEIGQPVDVKEALQAEMKVGDVVHRVNGFTNSVWLYAGFIFNNWVIKEPEVFIRIYDILGNASTVLWKRPDVQVSPNSTLTNTARQNILDPDTNPNAINCRQCIDIDNEFGTCDEWELFQGNFPQELYHENGYTQARGCDSDHGACCTPLVNDMVKLWPSSEILDTGHHSTFHCGVSEEYLANMSNYFNEYINKYTSYDMTTQFHNMSDTNYLTEHGGHQFGVGTNYYDVLPWGFENETATGQWVLHSLIAHDPYYNQGGNPVASSINHQHFEGECQQAILEAQYYILAPCMTSKGFSSVSTVPNLQEGGNTPENICKCDASTLMALDSNRRFNQVISPTGNQNLTSIFGTEIKEDLTEQDLGQYWEGQYECTSCLQTPNTNLGVWDVIEAPCGVGYGLLEPATVTLMFEDLEHNDFASISSTISYELKEISYLEGVCTIRLIDDLGQFIGEPIGSCSQATINPYESAEYLSYDITTIDNYNLAVGIVISNCGFDMIMCQTLTFSLTFTDGYQTSSSNLTVNWNGDEEISGCQDPSAYNYNPTAVFPCNDCCEYPEPIEEPEFQLTPGVAEGSKVALVYTADLDRWDQIDMEENVYGATTGKKGEVLLSSYADNTATQSRLKIFQADDSDEGKQNFFWVSKKMNFGYDSIYKSIKRIKIVFSKTFNSEDNMPYTKLMLASYPSQATFSEIIQTVEDAKTLKYEVPRNARKCKSIQFSLESKEDIESISIIYTIKGIK